MVEKYDNFHTPLWLLVIISTMLLSIGTFHNINAETNSTSIVEDAVVDPNKGYLVEPVKDDIYRIINGEQYQIMFVTTGEGVIVVDAPPSIGENIFKAISEITDEPITHLIYSHSHKDHIGAAGMFPNNITIIAHDETYQNLVQRNDSDRSIPTETFSNNYTLQAGDKTLELSYYGPIHQRGNIFVYEPDQKVLMLVDHVHPGWIPWTHLAVTEDVPAYIQGYDKILGYDFDVFVPGHGNIANRDHIILQ
ncbi:MAG: MBL fold metallo-hydrolase, partial [Nitrososphaeraceae archaeon]